MNHRMTRRFGSLAVAVAVITLGARAAAGELGSLSPSDLDWQFSQGRTTPDPCSVFEDHLGRSPRNAMVDPVFQYTYRGWLCFNGEPVQNFPADQVELWIDPPCQNPVVLNPDGPSGTDGLVEWGAAKLEQGGGACSGPAVAEVRVQGLVFKTLDAVHSPDIDGDRQIAVNDLVEWQDAFVHQGPLWIGDLDGDGEIALSDLLFFQVHFVQFRR